MSDSLSDDLSDQSNGSSVQESPGTEIRHWVTGFVLEHRSYKWRTINSDR